MSVIANNVLIYLIYLYILLFPVLPSKFHMGSIQISDDLLIGLIIVFYIFSIVFVKDMRKNFIRGLGDFFKQPISLFMLALLLIMFFSVTYSIDKKLALKESIRFGTYVALFFIIKYCNFDSEKYKNFIRLYIFSSLVVYIIGIYKYVSHLLVGGTINPLYRLESTLENPNILGAFVLISLFPLIMLLLKEKRTINKVFYIITILAALVNLVLSQSRNSLLGLGFGLFIFVIIHSYKYILALIPMVIASLFIPLVKKRIFEIFDMTQNISRIQTWKTAIYMIKDHPLLGVGNGNFYSRYSEYIKKYPELTNYYDAIQVYHPHNVFLKIQSELGIIGSISFVALIVSIVRNIRHFINTIEDHFFGTFYKGFLISFIVFIFMNLVDSFFSAPKVISFIWILVAVQQALVYNKKDEA